MPDPSHRDDTFELLDRIHEGSQEAWHRFIEDYAGLIHSVVHRYLTFARSDDRRDLFVSILEKLNRGALRRYDGRSRLSTWLFIFARSRCLDHLRSKHGRRALPAWLGRLPAVDRRVFRLYYVDGRGCREVREILGQEGRSVSIDELAASLERLEERLDDRLRRRMAYDLIAASVGVSSGRLLDFLHRLKFEYELQAESSTPEQAQLQREVASAAEQVREYVGRLPEIERKVIALRYYEGRTAREAARELNMDSQRAVYTIESRAIRRLKDMLET